MSNYEEAGVNIEIGDACSKLAYKAAKATFSARKNLIGSPALLEGGFSGALDMGDFYIVQNDDGVGSKSIIAQKMGRYDTLGYDLLAMVADDAICVGAEVISVSNTVDIEKVNAQEIGPLMDGLKNACIEQKIVIPGGEIAELAHQVKGFIWNATALGIVEKNKFIDGSKISEGDSIIGLRSAGFRSNGFTLIRYILSEAFGENWVYHDYGDGRTWGEILLKPSLIYHRGILDILGSYGESRTIDVHGIVHVTGGGLDGNVKRVLPKGLQPIWTDLWQPHEAMLKLMKIGRVKEDEARRTWNMGTGMALIVSPYDVNAVLKKLSSFEAKVIGFIDAT